MTSIFTKIINREIPGQFVYEDDMCVVLMDKFPSVPGQTLVIPKEEVDYLFDLPEEAYQHLCAVTKKVAKASDEVFKTIRTCEVVEGFEVPHAHIKLYPVTDSSGGIVPILAHTEEANDAVLEEQAEQIRQVLTKQAI